MLKDKIILITGGGSGIGAATAAYTAKRGAKLALAGIPPEPLQSMAQAVAAEGGEAIALRTDVAVEAEVKNAVRKTVEQFGRLDAVVANAGVQRHQTDLNLHQLPEDEWELTHQVNTMGVVRTCKHSIAQMLKQEAGGTIVIVSSITALTGTSPNVGYMTGKAGLLGLNRHIAVHYGKHGIRCNAVCPGALEQTPNWEEHPDQAGRKAWMEAEIPLRRLGKPEDIAPFIALLCSDEGAYASGAHFVVDGGFTVR